MQVKEFITILLNDGGPIALLLFALMTLVEIIPIKVNPWSAIFRWIGRQVNREVIDKINVVETRLDKHIEDSEESDLKLRRARILDFSSSIIRGTNYHKEKWDFMIAECDSYEKYCHDNEIINGVATASIEEIRKLYQERLHNGTFLSDREEREKL